MTKIFLLGEAKGQNEAKINSCFVGTSGVALLRMLDDAKVISLSWEDKQNLNAFYSNKDPALIDLVWAMHPHIHRTNVFQIHPPGNDLGFFCGPKTEGIPGYPALAPSKYVRKEFQSELDRLGDELLEHDPNLVIALGNCALWAMCGMTGISKVRGATRISTHTVEGFKVLPTYHPSAVNRQWELRPTTVADLIKAKREASSPELIRPEREIWVEPTIQDIKEFTETYIKGCDLLSVDIETAGKFITCIGFAPSVDRAIVIPFEHPQRKGHNYWETKAEEVLVWKLIKEIVEDRSIPKLFQNGLYDISFLIKAYGIRTYGAAEDTMLLQHALQPEALKGLGYLGSIYTDEGAWKHEHKRQATIKKGN